jgi:predicted PurR-regulated permease PerM
VRIVLIVITILLILYVVYLLRRPLAWLVLAAFLAVALSGPVNLFSRWMRRGLAIALVYLLLILVPVLLGGLLVPSMVSQAEELVDNLPQYAQDLSDTVNENDTLRSLNEEFDITGRLQEEAQELPSRLGDAAEILRDVGVGVVNSVFAAVTILVLSVFMLAGSRRWLSRLLATQPGDRAQRIERALDRIATAVGNYAGGALLQATIAGVSAFVVLTILGAPFAAPLALIVALFDLIPVVGATIAAVLVGIVLLFVNFPIAVIVWAIWAIIYQQVENYLIQPQIQMRAVEIEPFVVLVAVLFGSTLFGVLGAILAIPFAASAQIALREYLDYRRALTDGGSAEATASPAGSG